MKWNNLPQRLRSRFWNALPREKEFIFGIGLSKTGTSSLHAAFQMLGLKSIHYPPLNQIRNQELVFDWPWWMAHYDAASDLPAARFFRELNESFPRARFIYTHRNIDQWLESCRKHFNRKRAEKAREMAAQGNQAFRRGLLLNENIYGTSIYNEEQFRRAYRRHEARVLQYFRGSDRFLTLDVCAGDHWDVLCPFLGRTIPDQRFPWSKRAGNPEPSPA